MVYTSDIPATGGIRVLQSDKRPITVQVEFKDGKNDLSYIVPSSERIFSLSSFAFSCDFSNSPAKRWKKKSIKNNDKATHESFTSN